MSRKRAASWWDNVFPHIQRHYIKLDDIARYNAKNNQWYAKGRRGAMARKEALRRRGIVAKFNTIQRIMDKATRDDVPMTWREARDAFRAAGALRTPEEKEEVLRTYMERGFDYDQSMGLMRDDVEDAVRKLVS